MGGGHPEHDDGIEATVKQLIERGKQTTQNIWSCLIHEIPSNIILIMDCFVYWFLNEDHT